MSSYFYSRITFPNPHNYFIKSQDTVCEFKICHTRFFSASLSTRDNISSLSITKNMQKYEILSGFDIFFCCFPEYEK